ncbi:hypothetical protein GF406_06390 [candidate division KSB1 bacterium]|nr:hypothetical protein [candidate division KSB1 bacterium]
MTRSNQNDLVQSAAKESSSFVSDKRLRVKKRIQTFMVVTETLFVLVMMVIWLSSSSLRQSQNLWILFFYSVTSQFLIAIVPHEPVYFYFAKFYPALTVTLVSVAGTLLAEFFNYSFLRYISDFKLFKKVSSSRIVQKLVDLFNVSPFSALLIAGITPVPFYPFRFMVAITAYPLFKYLLAVFFARSVRFYIFAEIGYALQIPNGVLLIGFAILLVVGLIPALNHIKNRHLRSNNNQWK